MLLILQSKLHNKKNNSHVFKADIFLKITKRMHIILSENVGKIVDFNFSTLYTSFAYFTLNFIQMYSRLSQSIQFNIFISNINFSRDSYCPLTGFELFILSILQPLEIDDNNIFSVAVPVTSVHPSDRLFVRLNHLIQI